MGQVQQGGLDAPAQAQGPQAGRRQGANMLFQGGAQVAHLTLVQSCDTVHGGALARGWFLFRRLNCPLVGAPPTTSLTSPTWRARQAAGTTPFRTPGYPPSFPASSDEIPQTPVNNPHFDAYIMI